MGLAVQVQTLNLDPSTFKKMNIKFLDLFRILRASGPGGFIWVLLYSTVQLMREIRVVSGDGDETMSRGRWESA